jgi:hypothetical protein
MSEQDSRDFRPHVPIPLDPESISIKVVTCPHCTNGRKDTIEGDDPQDLGYGGCCEGLGVALEVTPGLEPLVLYLAASAAGAWAYARRPPHGDDTKLEFNEHYCEDIEERMVRTLERLRPHEMGARPATTWDGSLEQERDRKILAGEPWP